MLCTDRSIYERSTSQYLVDDDDEGGEGEGEGGEEISVFTYLDNINTKQEKNRNPKWLLRPLLNEAAQSLA